MTFLINFDEDASAELLRTAKVMDLTPEDVLHWALDSRAGVSIEAVTIVSEKIMEETVQIMQKIIASENN